MGLDKKAETLCPLGFAGHVKKCNVLKRSKTYSICGASMSRESIQKHETACRARREEVNPRCTSERENHWQETTGP